MLIAAGVIAAWLQYAADGKPHVRAVSADASCPVLRVDARVAPMAQRAGRRGAFGDIVCEATIGVTARRVQVDDRDVPPPVRDADTIVVLGDTGCRLSGARSQSCDDPNAWPFPNIARSIAAVRPDVVIHVGDYLYRESPCSLAARCADSPYGDDAPAWYADFLAPAAPIFAAAPLVLLRGNHEECTRNGTGWFRYLDPHAATACTQATEPYAVALGGVQVVAFDSAVAEDRAVDPVLAPLYRRQFALVAALAKREASAQHLFVTHRPPYTNADERAAMGSALSGFDAVLSGHVHFFAAMNVQDEPPLLINGEGGTQLDPNYSALFRFAVGNLRIEGEVFGSSHFGFGVYRRTAVGWNVSLREADGTPRARCTIERGAVHCSAGG